MDRLRQPPLPQPIAPSTYTHGYAEIRPIAPRAAKVRSCLIPLHLVSRQVLVEGRSERLEEIGDRAMLAVSKREPKCKFPIFIEVQLSGQGDVAVSRAVKFPVHPEVIVKVGPAIARANVAAREVRKGTVAPNAIHLLPFCAIRMHWPLASAI